MKPIHDQSGVHSVSPHLVCADAASAIEFYKRAFDAVEMLRLPAHDGKLLHACVSINGSSVMLIDENPQYEILGPARLGATPVTIHLNVTDVDAAVTQAVAAGAKIVMPVAEMFWGDRYGVIEDPFGHRWSIATPQKTVTVEEMQDAAKNAFGMTNG